MGKFANREREGDGGPARSSILRLRSFLPQRSCKLIGSFAGEQGDVDILEDLTGCDAENAVGRFDEIVALATGVLTAEDVGEGEAGGELLGFDQKTGAVGDPWR